MNNSTILLAISYDYHFNWIGSPWHADPIHGGVGIVIISEINIRDAKSVQFYCFPTYSARNYNLSVFNTK